MEYVHHFTLINCGMVLLGLVVYMYLQASKAIKRKNNTPRKFSLKFIIVDNSLSIVGNLLCAAVFMALGDYTVETLGLYPAPVSCFIAGAFGQWMLKALMAKLERNMSEKISNIN